MKKLDVDSDMYRIVGCAMKVYNTLKSGYLESVYEKALEWELLEAGFSVKRQVKIPVFYKGIDLGKAHEKQSDSYLKCTGISDGLLVNFGNMKRLEWRVYSP